MTGYLDKLMTRYRTHDAAESIAVRIRADDQDWTYAVEEMGGSFVIAVYDESAEKLGYL